MKTCFKCNRSLPLSDFYRHPEMSDGRLGKCKDCAKADARRTYREHRVERAAYERRRAATPKRKAQRRGAIQRRRERHPDKTRAWAAVRNAVRGGRLIRQPCESCGTPNRVQGHHEDYSKPLDVRWLCFACHRREHGQEVVAV